MKSGVGGTVEIDSVAGVQEANVLLFIDLMLCCCCISIEIVCLLQEKWEVYLSWCSV